MKKRHYESPVLSFIVQSATYAIMLLAVWLYFRGHQEPGGGFVAGLVVASIIALQGLAFGLDDALKVFPLHFSKLLGLGLATAASTVILPALFGQPFMKHFFGHIHVPLMGTDVEWATAAVFDLGVFLVVVGCAKGVLLYIAQEKSEDVTRPGEHEKGARSGGALDQ